MDTIDIGEEMFIKGEGQCLCVDLHPTEEWLLVSRTQMVAFLITFSLCISGLWR